MSSGSPSSPDVLKQIKQNAEGLLARLQQEPVAIVLRIAGNPMPIDYTQRIINQAGQYIQHWLLGPDQVDDVSQRWAQVSRQAQQVATDYQGQLDYVKNHWTGAAAEDFATYADSVLNSLKGLPDATKTMSDGLSKLSEDLRSLRDTIVGSGAKIAAKILNASTQIGTTMIHEVDALNVATAEIGVGEVRWCAAVAGEIANQLTDIITDLIDMGEEVDKLLGEIKGDADGMKNDADGSLTPPPAAPPDEGDTKHWQPAAD